MTSEMGRRQRATLQASLYQTLRPDLEVKSWPNPSPDAPRCSAPRLPILAEQHQVHNIAALALCYSVPVEVKSEKSDIAVLPLVHLQTPTTDKVAQRCLQILDQMEELLVRQTLPEAANCASHAP